MHSTLQKTVKHYSLLGEILSKHSFESHFLLPTKNTHLITNFILSVGSVVLGDYAV